MNCILNVGTDTLCLEKAPFEVVVPLFCYLQKSIWDFECLRDRFECVARCSAPCFRLQMEIE